MRTTVRIDDQLLMQAKKLALDEGRTLTSVIEEGLTLVVNKQRTASRPRKPVRVPVSTSKGRLLPGVDLDNSAALEDVMNSE